MKKLVFTLMAFAGALLPQAGATTFLPYLDPIRTEIINQQVIVSNAPSLDKPLATALRKALTTIDRTTPTNLVNDTKTLAKVTATLNKTSLSNAFDLHIRTALSSYIGVVENALVTISNSLNATFPSGPHTAANNLIAQAFDSVETALTTVNTTLATKALAAVVKKLPVIQNLLTKAINANAPPARITAQVTGSLNTTIRTQGAGITAGAGLALLGAQQQGRGLTGITLVLQSVPDGTHVVNVTDGGVNIVRFPGVAINYGNGTGTATVTRNNANGTAFGTFTFTASGVSGTTGNITVTGEFFGTF